MRKFGNAVVKHRVLILVLALLLLIPSAAWAVRGAKAITRISAPSTARKILPFNRLRSFLSTLTDGPGWGKMKVRLYCAARRRSYA